MGKFDMWEYSKQEKIFDDDERKEIWDILKKAGAGKLSAEEIKNYIAALEKVIKEHKK